MDKLIRDEFRDGLIVCVSCYLLNCWHGELPCDVFGCLCNGYGGSDRCGVPRPPSVLEASTRKVAPVTVGR